MPAPTVMTKDVLAKLKMAFLIGASDREACFFADIAPSSLYEYQKIHQEYSEQKKSWKESPTFKARQTLVTAIENNPDLALRYLERKKKDEFSLRVESTGKDGKDLNIKEDPRILRTILKISQDLIDSSNKIKDDE